ncbi:hypothetical protein B296_00028478 [Ensete ventricosum]|uniref:Uncharacterized protein n=1 Tax=Ensete ventricosum TaxID=4639 RepID=A0A426Y3B8_ENSVE|nr:hypothetical protein B296_00028478 [Ensete ventricosum]
MAVGYDNVKMDAVEEKEMAVIGESKAATTTLLCGWLLAIVGQGYDRGGCGRCGCGRGKKMRRAWLEATTIAREDGCSRCCCGRGKKMRRERLAVTTASREDGSERRKGDSKDGRRGWQGGEEQRWPMEEEVAEGEGSGVVGDNDRGLADGDRGRGWATAVEGWSTVDEERKKGRDVEDRRRTDCGKEAAAGGRDEDSDSRQEEAADAYGKGRRQ